MKNVEHPGNFAKKKSNSGSQIRKPVRSYPSKSKSHQVLTEAPDPIICYGEDAAQIDLGGVLAAHSDNSAVYERCRKCTKTSPEDIRLVVS